LKDGRNKAACHRRETANTGGATAPNGAGSAVDGTPRTAMVSVDWFGLTGGRNRPVFSETGIAFAELQIGTLGASALFEIQAGGRLSGRWFCLPRMRLDGNAWKDASTGGMAGERMAARDFINETLLPKMEHELADEAKGNKHYLTGFEDALKVMTQFIELHRREWDVPE